MLNQCLNPNHKFVSRIVQHNGALAQAMESRSHQRFEHKEETTLNVLETFENT